jgi:cytochrome c oxidase subunit 1
MATESIKYVTPDSDTKIETKAFPRPGQHTKGIVNWLTTIDHKKIGIMYGVAALFFLIIGGIEALLIRSQLWDHNMDVLTNRQYNQMFTMHGTTMVFLVIMPLSAAFFNFIMPLQIGARDVAFPRMNTLSLWCFIAGGITLNLSWFFTGGSPAIGWFGYAPLTDTRFAEVLGDMGPDFWIFSLQILGLASLLASFNFITTIINMRAPGMTMMRLPVFTWMTLIVSFLIILAFPAITIALVELMFDRTYGTNFYDFLEGGKPHLWQHLFWIFGHPEVYILILPAMGIVSEIIPVFSRKPLFGYGLIIFSGAIIGFMGFAVWSHHMFTTGMGIVATSAFSILTMLIAIPTGIKIFNWIGTMWGGRIRFETPMLFALGFITMFMVGGFTGIMHSSVPIDAQHQDSYFVVAHFHYVLIGGALFGLFAGFYFWLPKLSGKMLNERLGKFVFTLMFIGFNLTFFPMHYLGMIGQPRRTHSYNEGHGFETWNQIATIGAFILGVGIAIGVYQFVTAAFNKKLKPAGKNPWDARTLEWTLSSPVKEYNFARTPIIKSRDQAWENNYGPEENHSEKEPLDDHGVHMPDRSWYPLVTALGLFGLVLGMLFHQSVDLNTGEIIRDYTYAIAGGVVAIIGIIMWSIEGPAGYHLFPKESEE